MPPGFTLGVSEFRIYLAETMHENFPSVSSCFPGAGVSNGETELGSTWKQPCQAIEYSKRSQATLDPKRFTTRIARRINPHNQNKGAARASLGSLVLMGLSLMMCKRAVSMSDNGYLDLHGLGFFEETASLTISYK